tara:strand:- start:396 stop:548 length:153 start_codon:yes stop_codon:yes gene_type:complete
MTKKEKAKEVIQNTATFVRRNWRDIVSVAAIAIIIEDLDDVADVAEIIKS